MRFATPEEGWEFCTSAALSDYYRHRAYGIDINPFCTQGARDDWQRGFDNLGPRSYESPDIVKWDTIYNRGRAMALLMDRHKERT